jgi:hypothetical protein
VRRRGALSSNEQLRKKIILAIFEPQREQLYRFFQVDGFWSNTDSVGFVTLTQFRGAWPLLIENDQQARLPGRRKEPLDIQV